MAKKATPKPVDPMEDLKKQLNESLDLRDQDFNDKLTSVQDALVQVTSQMAELAERIAKADNAPARQFKQINPEMSFQAVLTTVLTAAFKDSNIAAMARDGKHIKPTVDGIVKVAQEVHNQLLDNYEIEV